MYSKVCVSGTQGALINLQMPPAQQGLATERRFSDNG